VALLVALVLVPGEILEPLTDAGQGSTNLPGHHS
jgi:hypothetical protein